MKKILRIAGLVILVLLIGIIGLLTYVKLALPNVGSPEDIKIEPTAARVERGRYLANSVSLCMDCHSKRDWNKFSGPVVEGTWGQGGEEFDQRIGLPGKYYAKNITPFALSNWTDGEVLRAIASGVNKDGKALFPIMPHPAFGKLDREDLYSIIAYLRTLRPVESVVPESESDFPMNFIVNFIPKKAAYSKKPDPSDQLAYGKYLFTAASCTECHTIKVKGKPVEGMEMAGGFEFPLYTGGIARSANITPDPETGIGNWTEDDFLKRFGVFSDSSYTPPAISKGKFNTVMPWMMYSTMKQDDLKAIYAYLKTLKPVQHEVVHFSPAEK
jgi:mono/diheme cytochrome c family protein